MRPEVSIVIPTQRRPGPPMTAARSVLAQRELDQVSVELVIVDNDAVPSAQGAAEVLGKDASFPVHYVHEPRAGVAWARNAALARASGRFIAFLDDDEEAPETWLADLLSAMAQYRADVVFGPVKARAPDTVRFHRGYLEKFFSRVGPKASGEIDHFYGCGNSLVRRDAMPGGDQPFSLERNEIGGEDDLLFGQMQAAGARFAWAAEAFVWEDPEPSRLNLRYTIARAFAYGQGPSEHCASSDPKDYVGLVRWMVIGLGQGVIYGLIAAVKWAVRADDRAEALDRAARGFGKTFWGGPFRIAFYGKSA